MVRRFLAIASIFLAVGCGDSNVADHDQDGYATTTDCNDRDDRVYPGAIEMCDEVDNDCNGLVDDQPYDGTLYYIDNDGDGFGWIFAEARVACHPLDGYSSSPADCDDNDASIHPDADELCDSVDHNCDGDLTTGAVDAQTFSLDRDGDGYGSAIETIPSCEQPPETVDNSADCNDFSERISPDATETCDGIDNNCDGTIDEPGAQGETVFYADSDSDGYGDETDSTTACTLPSGHSRFAGDCEPSDSEINPDAEEICGDGIDNNCDGTDNSCSWTGRIPVGLADVVITGDEAYSYAGHSVASAGDVNDDGFDDILIGAPLSNLGGFTSGAAYLFRGPLELGVFSVADADTIFLGKGTPWSRERSRSGDQAGFSVSSAGDIDGDGMDEVAIGAPWSRTNIDFGRIYIANDISSEEMILDDSWVALYGQGFYDRAGWAVASAGDFNNDTFDDVLIGAPYHDWRRSVHRGAVYILNGPNPSTARLSLDVAPVRIYGEAPGDNFGHTLAGGFDVNDDGNDDVLIGAPGNDESIPDGGAIYLLHGGLDGSIELATVRETFSGAKIVGDLEDESIGSILAFCGDLNDDGEIDIAIGVPQSTTPVAGDVYVLFGPLVGTVLLSEIGDTVDGVRLEGEQIGDLAGRTIAGLGDFNNDGIDDLAIGAPHHRDGGGFAGAVYLVYGPITGDMNLGEADGKIVGVPGAQVGSSIALAGDVNGDETNDLLVGAAFDAVGGPHSGSAFLFFGRGGL